MGLFRRSGPVVFERYSYGSRRRRWAVPNWLWLMLAGVAIGASGLWFAQEEYMPPRLGPLESKELQDRVDELERERARLQGALAKAEGDAQAARADAGRLGNELAGARASVERLQKDIALFDDVLPPDPRGGPIGVRGWRFANEGGRLAYHVLLTRQRATGKPLEGVVEFVVTGDRGGRAETISLAPVAVTLGAWQHVRGSLPLPEGLAARQVTVRVLDRAGGALQGMRVLNVR